VRNRAVIVEEIGVVTLKIVFEVDQKIELALVVVIARESAFRFLVLESVP